MARRATVASCGSLAVAAEAHPGMHLRPASHSVTETVKENDRRAADLACVRPDFGQTSAQGGGCR